MSAENPIEEHYLTSCSGPAGIVPEGKQPGENVSAVVDKRGDTFVSCSNFTDQGGCALVEGPSICALRRVPQERYFDRALLHIRGHKEPTVFTVKRSLGLSLSSHIGYRLVDQMIDQGVVEPTGSLVQGARGRPAEILRVTGQKPTQPYKYPRKN